MVDLALATSSAPPSRWGLPAAAFFATMTAMSFNPASELDYTDSGYLQTDDLPDPFESQTTASAPLNESAKSYLPKISVQPMKPSWLPDIADRLNHLSKKENGWKGPDSFASTPSIVRNAANLIWAIAREHVERQPSLGLDYEGTISVSWFDEGLSVDLTVYDDGSYSFYAASGDREVEEDDADLSAPLDHRLLSILLS